MDKRDQEATKEAETPMSMETITVNLKIADKFSDVVSNKLGDYMLADYRRSPFTNEHRRTCKYCRTIQTNSICICCGAPETAQESVEIRTAALIPPVHVSQFSMIPQRPKNTTRYE